MSSFGFTGTRQGLTDEQKAVLPRLLMALDVTRLHHGDCVGADDEADEIARGLGISIVIHPPDNPIDRAFCMKRETEPEQDEIKDPLPYFVRSNEIVREGEDGLIACPREDHEINRSGTWYTVRRAWKFMRPVWVIKPDGAVESDRSNL